jgi:murein DD-endopeptidase MepM/ murein hydrolase activator NlpD
LEVGPAEPITIESEKPRGEVISHKVQKGETISSIAKIYNISEDTIVWANNLSDRHSLSIGKELKIPPLTGVLHKIASGDSVYSIAKKYKANPQAIVDYYGNMIDETLTLRVGELVMVPDGEIPEAPRIVPRIVPPSALVRGDGTFAWPLRGGISQYTSSWHPGAIDITSPVGTAIRAADGGTVVSAEQLRFAYGWNILIDHGNGFVSRYAHLGGFEVGVGDKVGKGQVIGYVGLTGRTTGPHLHFEVIKNGVLSNPLAFLQ